MCSPKKEGIRRQRERERLEFLESRGCSEQEWGRKREEELETWRELERVSRNIGIQETGV